MSINENKTATMILQQSLAELNVIVEKNPFYIPVDDAATFLHMSPDCLRASIKQKNCPFRFSWRIRERESYKIPTLTFYRWVTGGCL